MQKTARLAGRLISQEGPRTFWGGWGGAPPQEVLGPSSEGPRPLLGYWNLLIYLPIWQFLECMVIKETARFYIYAQGTYFQKSKIYWNIKRRVGGGDPDALFLIPILHRLLYDLEIKTEAHYVLHCLGHISK